MCLALAACASGPDLPSPAPAAQLPDGTWQATTTLQADWNDLDASIAAGMVPAETTILDTTTADDRRTWSLITIDNQSGLLTATRDPTAPPDLRGCERLTLTATMKGPKSQNRAGQIIAGAAERLSQLAGVEWAPRR